MKILFFEVEKYLEKQFKQLLFDDELIFFPSPLTEQSIPSEHNDASIISIFVHSRITKKTLTAFPKLKLLITRSTGFDHIDMAATQEKKIAVCTIPLFASESVAEHTFALLLMLSKKMKQSCCSIPIFQAPTESLQGFELAHKTLGIIGFGNIGKKVAQCALGFTMKVLIHDDAQKKMFSDHYTFVDLTDLYKHSDIITFHVPHTKNTFHLFNKESLHYIKNGEVYIINTSRGEVIETEALLEGLENNTIAGIGLDVLEAESFTENPLEYYKTYNPPLSDYKLVLQNYALINHPNVIVTCHNAYNTQEALQRMVTKTTKIVNSWKNGENPCPT